MRQALLEVASNVRANEPTTIGFYISQDSLGSVRIHDLRAVHRSGGDGSTQ